MAFKPEKIRRAEKLEIYRIDPANPKDFSDIPYEGTIFTARLPRGISAGENALLLVNPIGGAFKNYRFETMLADYSFINKKILRGLRENDLCRFIIFEEHLKTAHPITERHWCEAHLFRPIYVNQTTRINLPDLVRQNFVYDNPKNQAIILPYDVKTMLENVLCKDSAKLIIECPELKNDFIWFKFLAESSSETLSILYDRIVRQFR